MTLVLTRPTRIFTDGRTSELHKAAESEKDELEQILRVTPSINVVDEEGRTPLCRAVTAQRVSNVALLLTAGANPNCGQTLPLVHAYLQNDIECAKLLLQHGASANVRYRKSSLLELAELTDNHAFTKLLLEHTAIKTQVYEQIVQANQMLQECASKTSGPRPLDEATLKEIIKTKKHLELVAGDTDSNTQLHLLARTNPGQLPFIIKNIPSKDWEKRNARGETPFLYVCRTGSPYSIHQFVEQTMCQDLTDVHGNTALHLISESDEKDLSLCEFMISHITSKNKALLEQKNKAGDTPLYHAIRKNKDIALRALLRRKANIEAENAGGDTALTLAVKCKHDTCIQTLIDEGVERAPKYNAPLLEACRTVHPVAVKMLLDSSKTASKPAQASKRSKDKTECPLSVLLQKMADKKYTNDTFRSSDEYTIFLTLLTNGANAQTKILLTQKRKITVYEFAETLLLPLNVLQELQNTLPEFRKSVSRRFSLQLPRIASVDPAPHSPPSTTKTPSPKSAASDELAEKIQVLSLQPHDGPSSP
jgi:ankyrin repeat protein